MEHTATIAQATETSIVYLTKNYIRYNAWANTTLVNWLRTKEESVLEQEVPSSFPSVRKTLFHILQAQQYWLSIIRRDETPNINWEESKTLEEVFSAIVAQSEEFVAFLDSMSAEQIDEKTMVVSPWFQSDFANFEYIMHVVNHGTYHRGQITTIGRNLGFTDAPMTDYNFFNIHGK
ncbi:DinB family protein [Chitinophaga niabensis]|uniref:Uncharacterized damage-inducible protein DinB (Forms a four-helix bundle) n=1 Tax=Chitinophaga niabensis TaxID=536979 RepID=A0A1N6K0B8_9BACT|nr:DinB family protein [Chitinophaga niabensis]SIO49913.1 Uncharacterized damage-inducible protein DinB (forms a four-helix bundle) [Chitinophaga niabensis]